MPARSVKGPVLYEAASALNSLYIGWRENLKPHLGKEMPSEEGLTQSWQIGRIQEKEEAGIEDRTAAASWRKWGLPSGLLRTGSRQTSL